MNPSPKNPDARLDQILNALRTTAPPSGLAERISERIAAHRLQTTDRRARAPFFAVTENRASSTSFFAATKNRDTSATFFVVILNAVKNPRILLAKAPLYTLAATLTTLLLTLSTLTLLHHRTPSTTIALTPASSPALEGAGLQSRHNTPTRDPALAAEGISTTATIQAPQISTPTNTQGPQASTLGSHSPTQTAGVLTPPQQDPDAIALAETQAPSHPAPPMPLTPQERLLQTATQRGQPIQLAELDLARAPFLRAAAESRQQASVERYVRSLLAPFALADALSPTAYSQPQETPTPTPPPPPSNSSSN
jgi:hypothetical protein